MAETVQSTEKRLFSFIFTAFPGLVRHRRRISDVNVRIILYRRKKQKANGNAQIKEKSYGNGVCDSPVKGLWFTSPEKNTDFFLPALDFLRGCAILLYELNNLKPPLWRN